MPPYGPDETQDYPADTGEPADRAAWQADALATRAVLRYACPCGVVHEPRDAWVAAHWDEPLIHTCTACQRQNHIRSGRVLNRPRQPRHKKEQCPRRVTS